MTMSPDQPFLDLWTDWLAADAPRRLAQATIGEYKRQVVAFARWMETTLAVSFAPESITSYRVEQYVATLEVQITRKVRKPATLNKAVAALASLGAWLVETGVCAASPARRLRTIGAQPGPPKALEPTVVTKLLDAAHHTGDLRDALVIEILAFSGMRASEVAAIQLHDLELGLRTTWVSIVGKGYKRRRVPLPKRVGTTLQRYLDARAAQVSATLTPEITALLDALFVVDPVLQRSRWDWLKGPSGKPTLTNLKASADRLAWLVAYRPLMALVEAFPEAKRRHFATEARANRELGRVRRTGLLLRIMAEAELRAIIQREANKSEQFNRFLKWLAFGSAGVIRENDRAAQQKALKYNLLLANAIIFYNTVMLSKDLRTLITRRYYVDPACVVALSPYAAKDLERFGKYTLHLAQVPDRVDYHMQVVSQVPLEDPDRPGKQTSSEQREVGV